ncbi:MAG: FtsX-like permease family protein [Planctomycetota bacterium]
MTFLKLAIRGLLYHWRVNATVALGVAAATAVLTGALVVGDSVRYSLREMTIERLGRIDHLLRTDRFFDANLLEQLRRQPTFQEGNCDAAGLMLFPESTVEGRKDSGVRRAGNVLVVASSGRGNNNGGTFWDFGDPAHVPRTHPEGDEVVLNRQLADELDVTVGDKVTLRLPKPQDIPADSSLGEKTDRIRGLPRMSVVEIIEDRGLGRFTTHPSQSAPRNAYVALEYVQNAFRQSGTINSIVVGGPDRDSVEAGQAKELTAALRPGLDDLGLNVRHSRLTHAGGPRQEEEVIYDYYMISSDRMILPPVVAQAAQSAFSDAGGQPVLTYLANRIELVEEGAKSESSAEPLPYSLVAAIDPSDHFQLRDSDGKPVGPLADDEIVLTSWAAEDLSVKPGDELEITYFRPESSQGASEEGTAVLNVAAIVPLTPPASPYLPDRVLEFNERPTIANDPNLTPEVRGLTDQESIDDWEVPFVVDYGLIRPKDEEYWENHGTTPKAYVSLATGRRLWGSRFGQSTSYRVPARSGLTREKVEQRLLDELADKKAALGFAFRPIKRLQLNASRGNTPFNVLFLLLSFFVIAAALLLVVLLFRLGFEQRASECGLLLAVGWNRGRLRRLLVTEAVGVAAIGGGLGIVIGLGYAALILAALQSESWWLGAIQTPFLEFHYTSWSLLVGYTVGVLVSVLTIVWNVMRTRSLTARRMLGGHVDVAGRRFAAAPLWLHGVFVVLLFAAIALALQATRLSGQAQAGAFVGAGGVILVALLLEILTVLRGGGGRLAPVRGNFPVLMLAARSAARNPTRSTLTIGLIAAASFLIVSISAFRLKPTETGTGGFNLLAESSQPIFEDLDSESGRYELLADAESELEGCRVFSFRVRPGDDASCGNLYRAQQPRVLGVPPSFVEYFDDSPAQFEFANSAAQSEAEKANPWRLLGGESTPDGEPIPVVIDKETAVYSLRLHDGIGEEFTFEYDGRPTTFRVVGLLSLSVLHGNLLISESDFRQLFPDVSGYRYALIRTPPQHAQRVTEVLEDKLSDQGFDAKSTEQILRELMALQNTYLRTFQALGALGLLLGTFGLAAAQMRSVLERRGEMALLRATGFRRSRLRHMLLLENVLLLLFGLAAGIVAAMLAVLPHMFSGGAAVPFSELAAMLAIVLVVGMVAGWIAARATLRVPLLAALREER